MMSTTLKKQFDEVLKEELLYEIPPSFSDAEYFDEVALYSRFSQLEFLKRCENPDRSLLLLSLDYMHRVADECHPQSPKRLLSLAVVRHDSGDPIVPCIFVCNRRVKSKLKGLHLKPPTSALGKYVQSLLKRPELKQYVVLEDRSTVPDDVRVFVGFRTPPAGIARLQEFATRGHQKAKVKA